MKFCRLSYIVMALAFNIGGGPNAVAEQLLMRRACLKPDDPYYVLQWNLRAINLPQAWDYTTGSKDITVAVVDSGISNSHPELTGRILQGWDFISDPENAGDGDGRDANPTDMGTNDRHSTQFHGTSIAGIIAATSNNHQGMTGVDWACKILPVRVLGIQGNQGADQDIADGIRWAAGLDVKGTSSNLNPAQVIVLAFGNSFPSVALEQAIDAARQTGAILVAAAGNENQDVKQFFPAAIDGVISVGAMDYDGTRARYSNFGTALDLMAPGGFLDEILPVTYQNQSWSAGVLGPSIDATRDFGYRMLQGTSVAAPQVAGVIALMLAQDPSLNEGEVLGILKKTAVPLNSCGQNCGAGLLDAAAALNFIEKGYQQQMKWNEWSGNMGCSFWGFGLKDPPRFNFFLLGLVFFVWLRGRGL